MPSLERYVPVAYIGPHGAVRRTHAEGSLTAWEIYKGSPVGYTYVVVRTIAGAYEVWNRHSFWIGDDMRHKDWRNRWRISVVRTYESEDAAVVGTLMTYGDDEAAGWQGLLNRVWERVRLSYTRVKKEK